MDKLTFTVTLTKDEEKVAQLLTRDAWGYFGQLIASRDLFHVKDIPMMPRRGSLTLTADEELVQYYLDYAAAYHEELTTLGWDNDRINQAAEGFALKLEDVSGQVRGSALYSSAFAVKFG
jgi:hypothetical protein